MHLLKKFQLVQSTVVWIIFRVTSNIKSQLCQSVSPPPLLDIYLQQLQHSIFSLCYALLSHHSLASTPKYLSDFTTVVYTSVRSLCSSSDICIFEYKSCGQTFISFLSPSAWNVLVPCEHREAMTIFKGAQKTSL